MFTSRKIFEWGGICASVCLVAFGIAAVVLGVNGVVLTGHGRAGLDP